MKLKLISLLVLSSFVLSSAFAIDNFRLNPSLPENVEYLNSITEQNTKKEQTRAPSSVQESKEENYSEPDEKLPTLKYDWQKRHPRDDK